MQLSERVQLLRKELKLTQQALATRTGLRPETISRIERGVVENPEGDTLAKLACGLGVKIDELVGSRAA